MIPALQARIDALADDAQWGGGWYQPIVFPGGERTHSTKMGDAEFYGRDSLGLRKWERIIAPNLPCSLKKAEFLEIGSNAGLNLILAEQAGANAWGVEPHPHFFRQWMLVQEAFGSNAIVFNQLTDMRGGDFELTLLANSLYWICYSDAGGFVPNHERVMASFLAKLATATRYVLIVGSESNKHAFGATLADVIPRLEPHFEVLTAKEHRCDRHLNIITGRSKCFI